MSRLSWDQYGLAMAETAKLRAACRRRQVGACIMDETHHVISLGYNGTQAGEVNCSDGGCPRGALTYDELPAYGSYSNCKGFHAEVNAIIDAHRRGMRVEDCTIYVTFAPCSDCSRFIEESGITRVVCP